RRHLIVSNARLAVAATIALLLWLAFFRATVSPWWVVAGVAGFVALVVFHARVLQRLERSTRGVRLYERGLERLSGQWAGGGRGASPLSKAIPTLAVWTSSVEA